VEVSLINLVEQGNTGPFWIGSGFALLSALIVFVGVRPLEHDGMLDEDEKVSTTTPSATRNLLTRITLSSVPTWKSTDMTPLKWA
jgi:hypothetical protein